MSDGKDVVAVAIPGTAQRKIEAMAGELRQQSERLVTLVSGWPDGSGSQKQAVEQIAMSLAAVADAASDG